MPVHPGDILALDVDKPAAGGRMLARHEGQVVLVWGAIPGERVRARVERAAKGVVYAETVEVLSPSPDRREPGGDWRCGGNVYTHIRYARQVGLKGEIIRDAFGRIGRVPLAEVPEVIASPERGYRMRARLHARGGRLGFYREGTHDLCDAAQTGQLLPATNEWIRRAEDLLRDVPGVAGLEVAENIPADQRACLVALQEDARDPGVEKLAEALGCGRAVVDYLQVGEGAEPLALRRDVRAFFQGNRYLLERLVRHVAALVPAGPVVDLYAGVGLFGLALAAAGARAVTLVEGDQVSGTDLQANAAPFGPRARVERRSVESYLRSGGPAADATFIVDPPRTGMTRDAVAGIIAKRPSRIVYVSCDVATLARDTRTLLDAGYELGGVVGFDLFPNTAHVESVALFHR